MSWRPFLNNPCRRSLGDCAVRAVAVALGIDWYEAYDLLCAEVLMQNGFSAPRMAYGETAEEFCLRHPHGVYVLAFGGHVATVVDGDLYDLWDSSGEAVRYYYARR